MNAQSYRMTDDREEYAVVDVGGDDRGALALGRFSEKLKIENNYDALFVLNKFRPETRTVSGALEIFREIESSGRLPFTGIVNNSNLGDETEEKTILEGLEFAKEFSLQTGLPVVFTAIKRELLKGGIAEINGVLPIDPIKYGDWY